MIFLAGEQLAINAYQPSQSRNDKMQHGFVTPTNNPSSTIKQQPNATRFRSAVNGMIILCSQ